MIERGIRSSPRLLHLLLFSLRLEHLSQLPSPGQILLILQDLSQNIHLLENLSLMPPSWLGHPHIGLDASWTPPPGPGRNLCPRHSSPCIVCVHFGGPGPLDYELLESRDLYSPSATEAGTNWCNPGTGVCMCVCVAKIYSKNACQVVIIHSE